MKTFTPHPGSEPACQNRVAIIDTGERGITKKQLNSIIAAITDVPKSEVKFRASMRANIEKEYNRRKK